MLKVVYPDIDVFVKQIIFVSSLGVGVINQFAVYILHPGIDELHSESIKIHTYQVNNNKPQNFHPSSI